MRTPWNAALAEGIGAGLLTFVVLLSLHANVPLATPVAAGLALMLIVYILGPVSGAHVNPAVTVGLWTVGKIAPLQAASYIVAQLLGAVVAWQIFLISTAVVPALPAVNSLGVFLAEAAGAAILVCGVSSVAGGKTHPAASGLVVGGSLLLGILCAMNFSNGILNPAVAVGINSVSVFYLLGPLAGGVAGALLYRFLAEGK